MEEGVQGGEVWVMLTMRGRDDAAASHVAVLLDWGVASESQVSDEESARRRWNRQRLS